MASGLALLAPARAGGGGTRIEISGPVFPRVLVLYAKEGANFPASLAAEQALAHDASLSFDALLKDCAATHPKITLETAGQPLTAGELATNYDEIASCAYQTYTSKPYWIPQLVDDVDICGTELGSDWRLLSQADVEQLTPDELAFLSDTITSVAAAGSLGMGSFYFSLRTFVRAKDGSIQQADLSPGIASRITPLTASGDALKSHYEGGLSLRCIRQTSIP